MSAEELQEVLEQNISIIGPPVVVPEWPMGRVVKFQIGSAAAATVMVRIDEFMKIGDLKSLIAKKLVEGMKIHP